MKQITIKQLEDNIEQYIELYEKGDTTKYLIQDGDEALAILVPFDGPWTAEVKTDEHDECFIELPSRLLAKLGWGEGDALNAETIDGNIKLTKK